MAVVLRQLMVVVLRQLIMVVHRKQVVGGQQCRDSFQEPKKQSLLRLQPFPPWLN